MNPQEKTDIFKNLKLSVVGKIIIVVILSLIIATYVFLHSCANGFWSDRGYMPETPFLSFIKAILNQFPLRYDVSYGLNNVCWQDYLAFIIAFSIFALIGIWLVIDSERLHKVFSFIYKYRFFITVIIIALTVIFDLNNLSIFCWKDTLHLQSENAPVFGVPRWIRADEYRVWTPMAISQDLSGYQAFNPHISGGGIDTTWISMGGIPAVNYALPFKPLYFGFLVFGISRGFSFLFVMRSVTLFWVTYYCALCYTKNNKRISLMAGLMFLFAPYVQWWFSQSIAEVLIFGQLIPMCIYKLLQSRSLQEKIGYSFISAYSLGCLIMVGYPSWMIPVLYLDIAVIIWLVIKKHKSQTISTLITIIIMCLIIGTWMFIVVNHSKETLEAISNSSYPGERVATGGYFDTRYTVGLYTLTFPFSDPSHGDPSTASVFLGFFPAGLLLSVWNCIKQKKTDAFFFLLLGVELFFFYFQFVGVSETFAKLSLLKYCTHTEIITGVIDSILLLRALALRKEMPLKLSVPIGIVCGLASVALMNRYYIPGNNVLFILLLGTIFFYIILFTYNGKTKANTNFLVYCFAILFLLAGAFVNPLQRGVDFLTESNVIQEIKEVDKDGEALFMYEGSDGGGNILLLAGKRAFNSTQVYADIYRWSPIDPYGNCIPIYNRLCEINIQLTDQPTAFGRPDNEKANIYVKLNFKDLQLLQIEYIVTQNEYPEIIDGIRLEKEKSIAQYNIYHIRY